MNVFTGIVGLAASMVVLPLLCFAEVQVEKTEVPQAQTIIQEKLLELDRQLANKAFSEGVLNAFYPLLAKDAVLLPLNGHPVIGPAGCAAALKKFTPTGDTSKIKWEPLLAGISANEDVAYTHGRYPRGNTELEEGQKMTYGYYATIWKKTKPGEWQIAVSLGLINHDFSALPPLDMKKKVTLAKVDKITAELVKTELDFALMAKEKGTIDAFYNFIADTGLTISFDGPPNTKESYAQNLNPPNPAQQPTGKRPLLTWEPFYVFVSSSKDMAYDFGPYIFTAYDKNGNPHEVNGYFVTVWQRQSNNTWRFVLDGGNTSMQPE
jgi:ketosteroid isomerase-like protein